MQDAIRKIPFTAQDIDFLKRLYATSRDTEMAKIDWSTQEKAIFLSSQFELQFTFYTTHYRHEHFYVIWLNGERIGRFFIHENPFSWQLVDITLLPEYRGKGFGEHLIGSLVEKAVAQNKRVDLHVEPYNPALRLYQRLGFEKVGVEGAYHKMTYDGHKSTLNTAS